jgi:membrane protein
MTKDPTRLLSLRNSRWVRSRLLSLRLRRFSAFFWKRVWHDRLPVLAGHLAYVSLLSIVPLLAVIFSVLSWLPLFAHVRRQVELFVFSNFVPATEIAFRYHFSLFVKNASKTTSIGLAMLAFLALLLMAAIDENMNHIWRCLGQRKMMKTFMMYSLVLLFSPLLIGGSLLLSSYIQGWAMWNNQVMSIVRGSFLELMPYLLSLGGICLIYKLMPNKYVRWTHALIGATLAAFLFEIAKEGFGYYIAHFSSYKSIYGALAGIPIIMIWLYTSWLVVLFGAELTATLGEWQLRRMDKRALSHTKVMPEASDK